jgi:hypothetical protein
MAPLMPEMPTECRAEKRLPPEASHEAASDPEAIPKCSNNDRQQRTFFSLFFCV